MPSTLFRLLERVMLREESLQFTISRGADQALTVLLQPVLKPENPELSADLESIRAALAGPLYLSLPAAEIDARFDDLVGTYAAARTELSASFHDMVHAIRDANKAARAQTTKTQTATARRTHASSTTALAGAKPSALTAPTADTTNTPASTPNTTTSAVPPPPRAAAMSREPDLFSSLT